MTKRLPLLFALIVALLAPLPAAEPLNVFTAKEAARKYINSGEYGQELTKVAAAAGKYVSKRTAKAPKPGQKLAIVFDIDETTLTNLSHLVAQDFGYVPEVWRKWVASGQAKPIVPVQLVYDIAVKNNVAVFFITARDEDEREATERNLRQVGYTAWTKAYFKKEGRHPGVQAYKAATRKQIMADGFTIIANVGDQESDLAGGYAERTFKLPNPFYLVK